jgi:Ankyrin repeats (3 copies)/Ankyrin repeat
MKTILSLTVNIGTIKLSHMSVKDYLLSRHRVGFGIDEKLSHSNIAQTCLAYLLQFNNPDMLNYNTVDNFPLAGYAATYWIMHVQSGVDEWTEPQQKLVMTLFQLVHTAPFITWVRLWDMDDDLKRIFLQKPSSDIASAIYYASFAGLLRAVQALIEIGADVKSCGGLYGNALQAASSEGHEAIVSLLLEKGADVNAEGGYYGNALQAASLQGNEAIVGLLLEKGADVNAQGGYYGNALQVASLQGHEAIVGLLVKKGADVNAQGEQYGNALQAASLEGHEAVVGLLLEKDADVNIQGGYYGNALQAASYK